jgi:hypothetical protein
MTWLQLADLRQSVSMPQKTLGRNRLLLACGIAALAAGSALAQQSVQPLPKVGGCPLGYYSSGGYCVPSSSGNTRRAIEKAGAAARWGSTHLVTTASAALVTSGRYWYHESYDDVDMAKGIKLGSLARFSLSDITVGVLTHSQVRVFE